MNCKREDVKKPSSQIFSKLVKLISSFQRRHWRSISKRKRHLFVGKYVPCELKKKVLYDKTLLFVEKVLHWESHLSNFHLRRS